MPSSRRMRVTGLIALLTVAIVFYVTTGASSTHNSAFYQRTLAALKEQQSAAQREQVLAEEVARNERVLRLEKEHNAAMAAAEPVAAEPPAAAAAAAAKQTPLAAGPNQQQGAAAAAAPKAVAGRKKLPADDKVVQGKPAAAGDDDGVAKVGNIAAAPGANAIKADGSPQTDEDHRVSVMLTDILKRSPIIIFSKSFCPYSKKAKHILLDLYNISPPPFVVELDQNELGAGLQKALEATTGRRTVPNILINGKSVGGGDEIEAMHRAGKLVYTIFSMGGRRIVQAALRESPEEPKKAEVKFKA